MLIKKVWKKKSKKVHFFLCTQRIFFVGFFFFFSYLLLTSALGHPHPLTLSANVSNWPPSPTHLFADVILEWSLWLFSFVVWNLWYHYMWLPQLLGLVWSWQISLFSLLSSKANYSYLMVA